MPVTLSFDNGPTPGITEQVLHLLGAHGVRATFFVIGEQADRPNGRALVRAAVEAGHRVGAHTWTHSVPFGLLDDHSVRMEIERTAALVDELGGDASLFRPYAVGGAIDERLMSPFGAALLRARAMTCAMWNSLPLDWIDPVDWPEHALADVDRLDHAVIVLHDIADASLARLGEFLDALARRDVECVTELPDECVPIRHGVATGAYGLLGLGEPPR